MNQVQDGPVGTDFQGWTEEELRAFLDQRGEDFEASDDKAALVGGIERGIA